MREIPREITEILQIFQAHGFQAYLVGGCVRDMLLGKSPKDWDICTNATPDAMLEIFPDAIKVGEKFGTIGIKSQRGIIEATTFRKEHEYKDFRHPEVSFVQELNSDLQRRDFTINAIAYHPQEGLIDPWGGIQDLEQKLLRCVGESKRRFQEDALRILRLLRFACTLDFRAHPQTLQDALQAIPLLEKIAKERIRDELIKILQSRHWAQSFHLFFPIYQAIIPEIKHPCTHKISNLSILFALLFQSLEDLKALERLKIDCTTQKRTKILMQYKPLPLPHDRIGIKLLLKEIGYEHVVALFELKKLLGNHIQAPSRLLKEIMIADECFMLKDLKLNGDDLIALGYRGKVIGEILESLLLKVITAELPNTKEALLGATKAYWG